MARCGLGEYKVAGVRSEYQEWGQAANGHITLFYSMSASPVAYNHRRRYLWKALLRARGGWTPKQGQSFCNEATRDGGGKLTPCQRLLVCSVCMEPFSRPYLGSRTCSIQYGRVQDSVSIRCIYRTVIYSKSILGLAYHVIGA